MNYSQLISTTIKRSGLTLRDLSNFLMQYNIVINPSYISKMQTGKQIPSDKINVAMAKILNIPEDQLLFAAAMDKAPKTTKTIIDTLMTFARDATKIMLSVYYPHELAKIKISQIDDYTDFDFFSSYANNPIIDKFKSVYNKHTDAQYEINMPDDSMEPEIPENSILFLTEPTNIVNGDIVVATTNSNDSFLVRRIDFIPEQNDGSDRKVVLIPKNKNYSSYLQFEKNIKISAKVRAVLMEIQ